ncbi:MAG: hypothetical protein CMH52_08285 [Myxococcales bacterium]|nr:hypothetical protein [Myxococcales bacterium]
MIGRFAGLLCLVLGLGCAVPKSISWTEDNPKRGYRFALADWTRTSVAYHEFQTQIFVQATLLSPAFSKRLTKELTKRAGLTEEQARQHAATLLSESNKKIKVFMAVATSDSHWNDLDQRSPTLIARLYVNGSSQAITPTQLEFLNDNEMADKRPFFPYADRLKTGYLVEFPYSGTQPKKVRLTVSGAPGLSELSWRLDP